MSSNGEEQNGATSPISNGATTPISSSMAATINGHAAIQRGLGLLAETDMENNLEEIKKLDSQIDHFNNYLDKFEARNNELNKRLNTLLESQKEERQKRRLSFQQKEEENREATNALDAQMRALLNRCHQARRVSMPEVSTTTYVVQEVPHVNGIVEEPAEHAADVVEK